jgi:hypothetical protein
MRFFIIHTIWLMVLMGVTAIYCNKRKYYVSKNVASLAAHTRASAGIPPPPPPRPPPQGAKTPPFSRPFRNYLDTPRSLGLLWTSDQLGAETCT